MFPIELSYMPLFLIPFYCPHASSIPCSFQTKIFSYLFWFLLGWKVEVNNKQWKNKTKTKKQKKKLIPFYRCPFHSFVLSLPSLSPSAAASNHHHHTTIICAIFCCHPHCYHHRDLCHLRAYTKHYPCKSVDNILKITLRVTTKNM